MPHGTDVGTDLGMDRLERLLGEPRLMDRFNADRLLGRDPRRETDLGVDAECRTDLSGDGEERSKASNWSRASVTELIMPFFSSSCGVPNGFT